MIITFDRRGFANNSSSSHSIIFSPHLKNTQRDEVNEYVYGWETFTITSTQGIEKYLFTQLMMNYDRNHNTEHLKKSEIFRKFLEKKKFRHVFKNG